MSAQEKKYRWACPSDWLDERIADALHEGKTTELAIIARDLLANVSEDDIQDIFQSEMEAGGYFSVEVKS